MQYRFWLPLLLLLPTAPVTADYWEKIPHWIEYHCEVKSDGNVYAGSWVAWDLMDGADKYFSDSSCIWYDLEHGATDNFRALGGCGPCGEPDCPTWEGNMAQELRRRQGCFEIWAHFPEGKLELEKIAEFDPGVTRYAAKPGETVNYRLIYRNPTDHLIADAVLVERLPPHVDYVAGGNPQTDGSIRWQLGPVAPGGEGEVYFRVKIAEDLPMEITEVLNLAVIWPDPEEPEPPDEDDPTTTDNEKVPVLGCDQLLTGTVQGDVQVTEPDAGQAATLHAMDVLQGGEHLTLGDGVALFRHTLASGELTIDGGGFTFTPCNQLDDAVLSQMVLDSGSHLFHRVSGILGGGEFIAVKGQWLALRIHEGAYRFTNDGSRETVTVSTGEVTLVDPEGNTHTLRAGETFSWPDSTPRQASGPPHLVSVTPSPDHSSPYNPGGSTFGLIPFTYRFDQPVTALGAASSFYFGKTNQIYAFFGTLDELTALDYIRTQWNDDKTELTVNVVWNVWRQNHDGSPVPGDFIALLHLVDVEGEGGTTATIGHALPIYLTGGGSSSGINIDHDHFHFWGSQAYPYELEKLTTPPGPLPEGLALASPIYHFTNGGLPDERQLTLSHNTRQAVPEADQGGGLYLWRDGQWQMVAQGTHATWSPDEAEVTVAQLYDPNLLEPARITEITPSGLHRSAAPDTPLVIRAQAPLGLDMGLTKVRLGDELILSHDPRFPDQLDPDGRWQLSEADGVSVLSYTPEGWPACAVIEGSVTLAGPYGGTDRQSFSFQTRIDSDTDDDGDGMPNCWEEANGIDPDGDDAQGDPDGDLFPNFWEYLLGTHPASSRSRPATPRCEGGAATLDDASLADDAAALFAMQSIDTGDDRRLEAGHILMLEAPEIRFGKGFAVSRGAELLVKAGRPGCVISD